MLEIKFLWDPNHLLNVFGFVFFSFVAFLMFLIVF